MARKPSKRWEKQVEMVTQADIPQWPAHVRPSDAVKLLSRQHARFVRMVKDKMPRTTVGSHNYARKEVLKDLLAALQQGGKK